MKATRRYWLDLTERLARPLLQCIASGQFRQVFDLEYPDNAHDRGAYATIESLSRLLAGIAPWLESGIENPAEAALREDLLALARSSLDTVSNPGGTSSGEWRIGSQPVVEAGFMSHALLRAPTALWDSLSPSVRHNLLQCLLDTRRQKPGFNNWLLFSALLEAFLHRSGEPCDLMRIDYALRQHEQWYAGDGLYMDGPAFHCDYYNSFVIHPMLVDCLRHGPQRDEWQPFQEQSRKRLSRYAGILERQISPEGTFPPVGRSLAYRFGAFQALAQAACMDLLPPDIQPAQVRCALTAVIQRLAEAPGTFTEKGFLTIGFAGHQPDIGEPYITSASAYLCATVLLPLALAPSHPFWRDPDADWTSRRLFNGENLPHDKALGH
ncbi:MAG TPA: DUF2264 domain-containing protein [Oceanipulchritudo sp.]|nr:DUF2264 domain-containing protein [Oceanipulchritudo sp.]